jgi:hypothetical protein
MASAGYSGTPLIKKLGIKPGQLAYVRGAPSNYNSLLGVMPAGVEIAKRLGKPHSLDFIHFFVLTSRQLRLEFPDLKTALTFAGCLWISWPKRSSKVETDLDENVIRRIGLHGGLVDVKIAAIDETWSGLKFMYRLKDRPGA